MPYIPLIPLDPGIVAVGTSGLVRAQAIAATVPADWIPSPDTIRPSSIPTPLSLAHATEYLISKGAWDHPFVEASALLLEGLVAGLLDCAWVDPATIHSKELRAAIRAGTGGNRRFGLVRDRTDARRVWAYIVDAPIPFLAGHALADLTELHRLLDAGITARRGQIGTLLSATKAALVDPNSATLPWMALLDHILARTPTRDPIDYGGDVRSLGPFAFDTLIDGKRVARSAYLLSYAPGFVGRFARALGTPGVTSGHGEVYLSTSLGQRVASVRQTASDALGTGTVSSLADPLPAGVPQVDVVAGSKALGSHFKAHYEAAHAQLESLSSALFETPHRLSDVARVVARFAPELVGEAHAARFSEDFKTYCKRHQLDPYLRRQELDALAKRGDAYVLAPSADASPATPASVFIERLSGADDAVIGELSQLGLALWRIFVGQARYHESGRYLDAEGEPLIEVSDPDFPVIVSETLDGWWDREAELGAVTKLLATLQRFIALGSAPEPEAGSAAGLAAAARRAFAKRVLASAGLSLEALTDCRAARSLSVTARPRTLALNGYGALPLLVDPLRASTH